MRVLINKRHGTFERFVKDVLARMNKVKAEFKETFEDEDIEKADVVFVSSKFPQVEKAKKLIYLQIVFPTERDERQQILDKLDQYDFYIKYLTKKANVVVEIIKDKRENDILQTYTKQFFIFKPTKNQDIFKRVLLAFEKIKMEELLR